MARVSTRVLERLTTQQRHQPQPSPLAQPAPPAAPPPGKGSPPATPAGPAITGRHTVPQAAAPQPTAGDTAQPRPRPPQAAPERTKPRQAAATPQSVQPPSQPSPTSAASLTPEPASGSARQPAAPKPKTRPAIPDLIDRLAAAFPAACDFHAPKPLAIGIAPLLAEALGLPMPSAKAVLARWVNRVVYLQAMAAPASRRVNLDGSDAGEVEEGHRLHAAEQLAALQAAIQPEPMPAGAPRPASPASR